MSDIKFEFERTSTGWSAYSPQVPGVGVAGTTREETEKLLREAIAFHFEGLFLETISGVKSATIASWDVLSIASPAGEVSKMFASLDMGRRVRVA